MPEMPDPKSIIGMLRSASASRAAKVTYANAYDRFWKQAQTLRAQGKSVEAEGAGWHASIAMRAYLAETNDPEPRS